MVVYNRIIWLLLVLLPVFSFAQCEEELRELEELSNKMNDLEESIERLTFQIDVWRDSAFNSEQKYQDLLVENARLEEKIQLQGEEIAALENNHQALENEINLLKQEFRDSLELSDKEKLALQIKLENANKDKKELDKKLLETKGEVSKWKKEYASVHKKLEDQALYVQELKAERKDYIQLKDGPHIFFKEKRYNLNQTIFEFKFSEEAITYTSSKEERKKIERMVHLIAKYGPAVRVKIVGNSYNSNPQLAKANAIKRAESIQKLFQQYTYPFDLNDRQFNIIPRTGEQWGRHVQVKIVKSQLFSRK